MATPNPRGHKQPQPVRRPRRIADNGIPARPPNLMHPSSSPRSLRLKMARNSRWLDAESSALVSRSRACRPPPGELARGRRSKPSPPSRRRLYALALSASGRGCIFTATGPGVFRPKRNDERREATRSAGMDRRPSPHRQNWAARVSSPVVQPGCIAARAPTGRTGPRGFHHRLLTRAVAPRCMAPSQRRCPDTDQGNEKRRSGGMFAGGPAALRDGRWRARGCQPRPGQ